MKRFLILIPLSGCIYETSAPPTPQISEVARRPGYLPAYPTYTAYSHFSVENGVPDERMQANRALCRGMPP